jgi:hypothetical protein
MFQITNSLSAESGKIRLCSELGCEPRFYDGIPLFLHIREQVPNYRG